MAEEQSQSGQAGGSNEKLIEDHTIEKQSAARHRTLIHVSAVRCETQRRARVFRFVHRPLLIAPAAAGQLATQLQQVGACYR
jgi:hypothetical protein